MAKQNRDLPNDELLQKALISNQEEFPYKIPENWCWTYLGKILSVSSGKGLTSREMNDEGLIPVYGGNGINGYHDEFTVDGENVVIGRVGAYCGCVHFIEGKAWVTDNALIAYFDRSNISIKFLYWLLNSINLRKNDSSSAQPVISGSKIYGLPIPLPPISEQLRIVEQIENLLSKLDEANEKVQEALDGFDARKATILNNAFSGELTQKWRNNNVLEATNLFYEIEKELSKIKKKEIKKVKNEIKQEIKNKFPRNWLLVDLDSISKKITDGEHKTPNRVDDYCGYYLLSARNVYNDSLRLMDVDYVEKTEFEKISKRCNPKKGDILISCSGSVGRCCVIDDDNNYCMVRSAAMVSTVGCNCRFIMYMIQSDYVQEQIKDLVKQTAQANLFIGAIAAIKIPLPPLDEQNEVVDILDKLFEKEITVNEILGDFVKHINLMKKSIIAKAFRGELGTNISEEESSIEILKKIFDAE